MYDSNEWECGNEASDDPVRAVVVLFANTNITVSTANGWTY